MNQITPTFLAWAAGFMDGEASFACTSTTLKPTISVGQLDRAPLQLLMTNFQLGCLGKPKKNGVSQWCVTGYDAAKVALMVLPYLQVKRRHAELIVHWAGIRDKSSRLHTPEERKAKQDIAAEIKALNNRTEARAMAIGSRAA